MAKEVANLSDEELKTFPGGPVIPKKQFHTAERMRDTLVNEAMESHQECLKEQRVFEPDWESSFSGIFLLITCFG